MNQYMSPFKNFRADELPAHEIGCKNVYNVIDLTRNVVIGKLYGDSGVLLLSNESCVTAKGMREIANLTDRIYNTVNAEHAY